MGAQGFGHEVWSPKNRGRVQLRRRNYGTDPKSCWFCGAPLPGDHFVNIKQGREICKGCVYKAHNEAFRETRRLGLGHLSNIPTLG